MENRRILVVHGPNLNLLGEREPEVYGKMTLLELNQNLVDFCADKNVDLRFFQSNGEGALIDFLHENRKWAHGVVINPGAYTHYSYSLRDAVSSINLPTIEVHLTDIQKREDFRKVSVIEPVCVAQISGFGWKSYSDGIERLLTLFTEKEEASSGG